MASQPDFVLITASSLARAESYAALVRERVREGAYPPSLSFRFYADPPNGRVGSGGGTVLALHQLLRDEGALGEGRREGEGERRKREIDRGVEERALAFFSRHRVLLIHAGGESRRLPCYVPEGKLFAPLPLPSPSPSPPVVLDVLLALYFSYPWQAGEILLASGDVIVHFDTTPLNENFQRGKTQTLTLSMNLTPTPTPNPIPTLILPYP